MATSTFIAVLILGRERSSFNPLFNFIEAHRYKIFPTFGIFAAIAINILVFDNIPHVQDGIHYKYMAEVFAHGKLAQSMPVHYEFFNYSFFMVDGSRHFSLFMPGYSLFLIPFALVGITFLANPILTGLNIFLVGRIAEILFDSRVSTYSMCFFFFSPFLMTMGGTWMPHPFTAMLTILAVYSLTKFYTNRRFHFPIVAGAAIAWMIFTRPQNALFFVILFITIGFLYLRTLDSIRTTVLFSAPLIVGAVILLAYNYNFTGSPTIFVQDIYFNISEPVNEGHRIGLGSGCYHCNGQSLPMGGMNWRHGVSVTRERIVPLLMETFPHPLYFATIILSLIMTINDPSQSKRKLLLVALFLSPVFGYFLFYFNGNVFGPRYLYEGTVFLTIVAASGVDLLVRRLIISRSQFGLSVFVAFVLSSLLFATTFLIPRFSSVYGRGFWGVDSLLLESVKSGRFEKSVFFVSIVNEMSYGNGLVAMKLWDFEGNENIFVRDLGDESNAKYMHYKKGWSFFRATYDPWSAKLIQPRKIDPVLPEDVIHVEMEDKFPPFLTKTGFPDYCNVFPVQSHIYPHIGFAENLDLEFSRKQSLYCRFVNENQGYTFGQYFASGGVYVATLAAVSGPEFGDLSIFVDEEVVASIDLDRRRTTPLNAYRFEIEVTEGLHTFRVSPRRDTLHERPYFMIDFIRFEKARCAG